MDEITDELMSSMQAMLKIQRANLALLVHADALRKRNELGDAEVATTVLIESLLDERKLMRAVNELRANTVPSSIEALIDALFSRADIRDGLGRKSEAEADRQQGLEFAKESEQEQKTSKLPSVDARPKGVAARLRQLAGTRMAQGQIHLALSGLAEARDRFRSERNDLSSARCAADLADAYECLRDFDRAIEQVQLAFTTLGVSPEDGTPLLDAGSLSAEVEALSSHADDGALNAMLALEVSVARGGILCDIFQIQGRILIERGDPVAAGLWLERARPSLPPYAYSALDYQHAKRQLVAGNAGESLATIMKIEPDFQGGSLRRKLGVLLVLKSRALEALGQSEPAFKTALAAREALNGFDDPDLEWKVAFQEGRLHEAAGRPDQALAAYRRATQVIDWLRRAPLGYRLDSCQLGNQLPVFAQAIRLAARTEAAELCCDLIDRVKSRQLVAVMTTPETSRIDHPLEARLDGLNEAIASFSSGGSHPGGTSFERFIAERAELLERLRIEDPRWRALTEPQSLDLTDVLDHLAQQHQAALQLFLHDDALTAILLINGVAHCASRTLSAATLRGLQGFAANLAMGADPLAFDPAAFSGLGVEELLPEGLLDAAGTAESLIVVPHRQLHLLPWAMLPFANGRLCQRWPVGIVPSLASLQFLKWSPLPATGLQFLGADRAGVGDRPLDLAGECELLQEIYGAGADRPNLAVTRQEFASALSANRRPNAIAHLACHGDFDARDPSCSGLHLADGKFDLVSIARLRIGFQEVILSACSTGHRALSAEGVELIGDDLLGIVGAFIEAGARSVLASITPAADGAVLEFSSTYHRYRRLGESPLHALQKTQCAMLDEGIFEASQWAGFTLFGAV